MAASVKGFVQNTLIYRALLMTFWLAALVLPWLLLGSACMLKAYVALTGRVWSFGSKRKVTD
jgi:hypothetical protein